MLSGRDEGCRLGNFCVKSFIALNFHVVDNNNYSFLILFMVKYNSCG